jgi:hypothetical protein
MGVRIHVRASWGSLGELVGRCEPATALSCHAPIAGISGSTPMMFIVRVML